MANLGLLNKNPGNLRNPATGGFQTFENAGDGYNALVGDLEAKKSGNSKHIKPGGTILDLANVWAPASDGNIPENWAKNVAKTVGVDINARWDTIPTDELAKGIQVAEGTSTISHAPTGQLSSNSTSEGRMTKEEFGKKIKAKYPQYESISDKDLADKVLAKYPQYKDKVMNTGLLETTPEDSIGEKLVDNSVTNYAVDKFKDHTVGNAVGGALNRLAKPALDLFAMPVQAGVSMYNELTGSHVEDPYKTMPIPQFETKTAGNKMEINDIHDAKGKAGSAVEVALETSPVWGKAALTALATRGSILKAPEFVEVLEKDLNISPTKFSKLSKLAQAKLLGNTFDVQQGLMGEGSKGIILRAITELEKESPGLLKKAIGLATGGKFGILDALGVGGAAKEGWNFIKKFVK